MKFVFFALLLTNSIGFAQPRPAKKSKLRCSGGSHVYFIHDVGSETLSLSSGTREPYPISQTYDGDCAGRSTYCSQDGQWMINVPEPLARGDLKQGQIWINPDTDDGGGLGDSYYCITAE